MSALVQLRRAAAPRVGLALVALMAAACGAQARLAARSTIVAAGTVVRQLELANEQTYVRETDALRERLLRDGALATYPTAVRPYDAEFDARTHAVAAASSALYAAAALLDLGQAASPAETRRAAGRAAATLEEAMAVLQSGRVMAPLVAPEALRGVATALRALASAPQGDAGGT